MSTSKFTRVQDSWIKENYNLYSRTPLTEAFNLEFGTSFKPSQIKGRVGNLGLRKSEKKEKFTDQQDLWIKENYKLYKRTPLAEEFNRNFGTSYTPCDIKNRMYAIGLRKTDKHIEKHPQVKFTESQIDWLEENLNTETPWEDIAAKFNDTFGTNKTPGALSQKCAAIGIFKNKGKPIPYRPSKKAKPELSERVEKNGYTDIKVNGKYIPKQRYVYEQAYGKLKDDEFILFLDGDKSNFSLSNLGVVTKRTHALMLRNKWLGKGGEVGETAIALCNLKIALSDAGKNNNEDDEDEKRYECMHYTHEHDSWLIENYMRYSGTQLVEEFNLYFGTSINISQMRNRTSKLGLKKHSCFKPNDEQLEYMRKYYSTETENKFCEMFMKEFKCEIQSKTLDSCARRYLGIAKKTQHKYSKEQLDFLKEFYPILPISELYNEYVKRFDDKWITPRRLQMKCTNSGMLKAVQKHKWTPEEDAWLLSHTCASSAEKAAYIGVRITAVRARCQLIGATVKNFT